jgi:hypothetical protein
MVFITRYKSAIKVCFWQWTACHSFSSAQLQVALRAALIKKQQARVPQQVSARWRNWKITSTHYTRERGRRGNSGISDWKRQRVRQSGSRMWVASQHQRLFCHGQPPRTAAFINNSSYRHFTRNALSLSLCCAQQLLFFHPIKKKRTRNASKDPRKKNGTENSEISHLFGENSKQTISGSLFQYFTC